MHSRIDESYAEAREWIGDDFDPEAFALEEIKLPGNQALRKAR